MQGKQSLSLSGYSLRELTQDSLLHDCWLS